MRMKLTKRTVEAIAGGEADVLLWDDTLRGFGVKEKRGIRPDGSNPCRHVETYPERFARALPVAGRAGSAGCGPTGGRREGRAPVIGACARSPSPAAGPCAGSMWIWPEAVFAFPRRRSAKAWSHLVRQVSANAGSLSSR